MSITINIYYKGKNGNAKKFVNDMISLGIVDEIRKEEGNLKYDYFYPVDDENTVLLIDTWESQEALDIHHELPVMKKISELREKYDLHMLVESYELIEDDEDNKYIRK